ncbi:MAG: hypothetical protein J2P36_35505 [Ktedonobacteraceae bacterium]|nr:hypothetical protein [Ktedonobacteraceae bacterium]
MGQQEFLSGKSQEEQPAQSYYRSARKKKDELKEEHPATFEDSIPPYSYQAQDRVTYTRERVTERGPGRASASASSTDGQTRFKRQQQQQWEVPSWARPQPQNGKRVLRWAIAIALIILVIKFVLPLIIGIIIALIAATAFLLLIPLLIVFALVIAAVVLIALALLGISGRLRLHHRR